MKHKSGDLPLLAGVSIPRGCGKVERWICMHHFCRFYVHPAGGRFFIEFKKEEEVWRCQQSIIASNG